MKHIVAGHVAVTATDFAELALGIDLELFTGTAGESSMERRARRDVAREVLAELRATDPDAAAYAAALMRTTPLPLARPAGRRTRRPAVAA
ncbi:hypothetical protein [Streptomyces sp. NPDC058572]|uniref:hypothetical protein n=1 Tax=Streptomyces sp. NPDC058572 TaxID=3346546 RepID=UPI003649ED97